MHFFPTLEAHSPVVHELLPTVVEISVGHDGHLGPYVVQLLQPPPEGREPEVVEAGGEDAQLHVLVRPQEAGHHLGTDGAGAPGQEPGDAVVLVRGQLRSMEPRQEAEFCVVGLILIELVSKDPTVRGHRCRAPRSSHLEAEVGALPPRGVEQVSEVEGEDPGI